MSFTTVIEHVPEARVIQVIEVKYICGRGVKDDPVRQVMAYYSLEGELLAERDNWAQRPVLDFTPQSKD